MQIKCLDCHKRILIPTGGRIKTKNKAQQAKSNLEVLKQQLIDMNITSKQKKKKLIKF